MSEYYAVQRSDEYLAHYGVRGMKWGVKKAIEKGNAKRLSRQYAKAQKKLAKLNAKADVNKQSSNAAKYNKIAKRSAKIGAAGVGTLAGLHLGKDVNNVLSRIYSRHAVDAANKYVNILNSDNVGSYDARKATRRLADVYDSAAGKASERAGKFENALSSNYGGSESLVGKAARVAAIGGLGVAAGSKAKAIIAKRRTTAKGHAKAVAKRDAWKKEMNKAFAGTQYANGAPRQGKRRKRRS